jgi:FPC/CPF motif-containing protein YcgG
MFSAGDLRDDVQDENILQVLHAFARYNTGQSKFASLAILFPRTPSLTEQEFESALWLRLAALQRLDADEFDWDTAVSDDPASPDFGMSFGGHGFYIVGMHPGASRRARRTDCATLIFNPHAQFQALRHSGMFDRIKDSIRARDKGLQGSINPMLHDHGTRSEAPQYSGRRVSSDWVCPFSRARNG